MVEVGKKRARKGQGPTGQQGVYLLQTAILPLLLRHLREGHHNTTKKYSVKGPIIFDDNLMRGTNDRSTLLNKIGLGLG